MRAGGAGVKLGWVLKSGGRRGCLTEKRETLLPARALRILAGAIAPATVPR
jgi:hypothetical protein